MSDFWSCSSQRKSSSRYGTYSTTAIPPIWLRPLQFKGLYRAPPTKPIICLLLLCYTRKLFNILTTLNFLPPPGMFSFSCNLVSSFLWRADNLPTSYISSPCPYLLISTKMFFGPIYPLTHSALFLFLKVTAILFLFITWRVIIGMTFLMNTLIIPLVQCLHKFPLKEWCEIAWMRLS